MEYVVSLGLLAVYLVHIFFVYSRHSELLENSEISQKVGDFPSGHAWVFVLVTIGLPLFCSFCASWVGNPVVVPEQGTVQMVLPFFLFNLAISIFVLMITIEIGYLYDDRIKSWRPYVIAALVVDLIALLLFLVVVKRPEAVVKGDTDTLVVFFGLVALGSLISSCGTIYYSKIHSLIEES
ncbi:hypothetical protein [Vibrio harveyi]|uniref:hypothetical protein n=1 Tax=Vibrio harveyi TaxID=669 RepID=UPI001A270370|nr:hypothetical protein [Vibrio harveyi]HAS6890715.1 hypothetical protein [Vibrio parahaemolyticus]